MGTSSCRNGRSGYSRAVGISVLTAAMCYALFSMGNDSADAAATKRKYVRIISAIEEPVIPLEDEVSTIMGLAGGEIVTIAVDEQPNERIVIPIRLGGDDYTLELLPHSIRSQNYQLLVQGADGNLVQVEPGPIQTYRGSILEVPGSDAAGSMNDDGLRTRIRMPNDDDDWWVEPLTGRIAGVGADDYVVYRNSDVIAGGGSCGVPHDVAVKGGPFAEEVDEGGVAGISSPFVCAEVACDADYEYYLDHGANVSNVENQIHSVICAMNVQYENEVAITHVISTIIVRTAEPDPYTATAASTLLSEFRTQWKDNHTSIARDIAHLFTGKNLDGGTIGVAWLGRICDSVGSGLGYGLVQSDWQGVGGNFAGKTDLSAHELGHNWNATHCGNFGGGCDCATTCTSCASTMSCVIQGVNTFANSNPDSIDQITSFRNTRGCLDNCNALGVPFSDSFPATVLDSGKWPTYSGAVINSVGLAEPSAPYSLNLNGSSTGGDEVRSGRIDTSNVTDFELQYSYQRKGGGDSPEAGEDLVLEFINTTGTWEEISRQLGSGSDMTSYSTVVVPFPSNALHENFRLRVRVISTVNNADDWFIDDLQLNGLYQPDNDDCVNSIIQPAGSVAFTTLGATTDGPNETTSCNFNSYTHLERDVWFRFPNSCAGSVTIKVCDADFNAKLAVYDDVCPVTGGGVIKCSDDVCGDGPLVRFFPTVFETYRIRIGGFEGESGNGTLEITCNPCPADMNGSGDIDVDDLLWLIGEWGPCGGCLGDINGDYTVNVDDLLFLIDKWGVCN